MNNQLKQNKELQILHHEDVEVPDFPRIEKVVNVILRTNPGKLLDIGYSKGSFADYLSEHGWNCSAIGLNSFSHPKINIIQSDLNEDFPVKSETFDVITAGEVIEHMFSQEKFLQECHRVLKKDGILTLTTPNLCFLVNRFLMLMGKTPMFVYAPYHYHFHTKDTIVELLEKNQFRIEQIKSSHVLYSRRRHFTGLLFEWLGDLFPTFGAHLIIFARKI